MQIDRMELADTGNPEELAKAVLKQIPELTIPVPIEDIAFALDITDIKELRTEGFEGGLVALSGKAEGVILVNRRSRPKRQRFTIGHELGHFVNMWHEPTAGQQFLCTSTDMLRSDAWSTDRAVRMEVEANTFAAELLMPRKQFRKHIRTRAGADLEHVLWLSEKYRTSKEATARRYVALQDEPSAVVFSHQGRIRYFSRSPNFPFLDFQNGTPVPSGSISGRSGLPEGVVSDWDEVDAANWLAADNARRLGTLQEQTVAQRDGYRMTLLTLSESDSDLDDDDADELDESWTPRFRR